MSIQFYKKLPNTLQSVKLQNIFQRSGRLTAWIQFLPPRSPDLVSPPVFEMNFHVINISFFAGSCHRIYVLDLGTSLCLCRTSSTKSCPAVSKQFTTLQQPTSTRTRVLWNNKHASKIVGTFWFPLLRTSSLSQRMPPDLTLLYDCTRVILTLTTWFVQKYGCPLTVHLRRRPSKAASDDLAWCEVCWSTRLPLTLFFKCLVRRLSCVGIAFPFLHDEIDPSSVRPR